ncbi:MAG: carboxypeptidase M32 [Amaricoccus sp.]|nr:carboxypeptidase M32 [Amaricoccus sp.]
MERVARLLGWDMETQMPRRGAAQRAEEAGAVARALHALEADPALAEAAEAAEAAGPDAATAVQVAEARRIHGRATRVPAALAAELAATCAEAQTVWERARAARLFADFAPALDRVVRLKRNEAACLAREGVSGYDALLDEHEPGMTAAAAAELFGALRPGLVDLRGRIAASGVEAPRLEGRFPKERQIALSRKIAGALGYEWEAGRIDLAAHPSCSGTLGDVRITTRVDEADPLGSIYSTIHEMGHALYEQGLDPETGLTPAGQFASMGVHESQSRLYENQIGRSRAFAEWLHPQMVEAFGELSLDGPDALFRAVNRVETGFIRTEADEVHYNLHVMLRFDLERALLAGDLDVDGLEAAWDDRFEQDFGMRPPDAAQGALQDVHWSFGAFGYFPTYTFGNVYAAALDGALRAEVGDLDARVATGDLGPALEWLRPRIHRRGRMLPPGRLIAEAAGREARPEALVAALRAKFEPLYGL